MHEAVMSLFVCMELRIMDFERLGLCDELIRAVSDQYWESVHGVGTDLLEDRLIARKRRFPSFWEAAMFCW